MVDTYSCLGPEDFRCVQAVGGISRACPVTAGGAEHIQAAGIGVAGEPGLLELCPLYYAQAGMTIFKQT